MQKTSISTIDENKTEKELVVQLKKSPCYGTCPVYIIQVYNDLTIIYKGVKNVDMIGTYEGVLDEDLFNKILNSAIQFNDDSSFKNEYLMMAVKDLPTSILTTGSKIVKYHSNQSPEFIDSFEEIVVQSIELVDWRIIENNKN